MALVVILGFVSFLGILSLVFKSKPTLNPCRVCRGPVSSEAGKCPHCGHPAR